MHLPGNLSSPENGIGICRNSGNSLRLQYSVFTGIACITHTQIVSHILCGTSIAEQHSGVHRPLR